MNFKLAQRRNWEAQYAGIAYFQTILWKPLWEYHICVPPIFSETVLKTNGI